jgi:nucleotide-binding universal stress UspA family protein
MTLKRILVAHDFSEPANRALAFALELAQASEACVDVVHVHPELYDGRGNPELGLPWPSEGQEERYLRFLDSELGRVVQQAQGSKPLKTGVRTHVLRGSPLKRLQSAALELGADLICVGSTGKGAVDRVLLGSVSQTLVRESTIAVLTVH